MPALTDASRSRIRSDPDSTPKRISTQPVSSIARSVSSLVRLIWLNAFQERRRPERRSSSQKRSTRDGVETKNSSWKRISFAPPCSESSRTSATTDSADRWYDW